MTCDPVRVGVIGLGRAFVLMVPTFKTDERVQLVAACAPRASARDTFAAEFGGRTYASATELCADPDVELVYVATPHQLHVDHVLAAAASRTHVLVEKPLAVSVPDGERIVDACQAAGVHLIVGPSHSFDAPVLKAREIIENGDIGRVRMLHALNCTDFLYRPRRPEELQTAKGGGVLFSQGIHQIDIVRLLCGGMAEQVSAITGAWDPDRPTEGAYSALIHFSGGAFATLTYSGYAHFDSDEWQGWIGELGHPKDPDCYGAARHALADVSSSNEEMQLKSSRTYGGGSPLATAQYHEHFGPMIAFCERGDLRLTPEGVHVYADGERRFVPCPMRHPRANVIDALVAAVRSNKLPPQTGAWGLASLEVCHAILESARTRASVALSRQIGVKT